jgi:hypothetical protein
MRRGVVTPVLFALVAVACAAAWMLAWRAQRPSGSSPKEPVREDVELVPGTSGELVLEDGRRLSVRIARLHGESARQSFDAEALRARFGLSTGEPFQCLVELRAVANAEEGGRGFDLVGARVEDERGVALTAFPAVSPSLIVDPLAALVAPPTALVPVENRVSLLLWGRAPGADARFETCCERPVVLHSAEVPAREIQTTLARVRSAANANGMTAGEAK